MALTWLDGGLATTLQAVGLPPYTPVDDWLDAHPEAVAEAHAAFVRAGAQVVLAGTFRLLPGVSPRWEERIPRALALARASGARVLASLGPADPESVALAAARCGAAEGVVLETWTDARALVAAVRAARPVVHGLLVASLCPRDDGCVWDGTPATVAVDALRAAGADVVGFNCGTGPVSVRRAVDASGAEWARPNRGTLDDDAVVGALVDLAGRCAWVGGCCGVGPALLARAIAASARVRPGA